MTILPASARRGFRRGPFQIHRVYPGLTFGGGLAFGGGRGDSGIAGLGCFDHAHLEQGLVVPMHQHVNDEIVSYLRKGRMIHEDSHGSREALTPTHLMGMNAGRGFWHEESVPVGEVDMLQIFVRPEAEDLPAELQFCDLDEAARNGAWRLIAGPRGIRPPLVVRQQVTILDCQLAGGESIAMPLPDCDSITLLYVFAGTVMVNSTSLQTGDGIVWAEEETLPQVTAPGGPADLIVFQIDPRAAWSMSGTISGQTGT